MAEKYNASNIAIEQILNFIKSDEIAIPEIHMYSTDNEIHLIINAKAKGEYDSGYLFSSSIEESDTRREYVFDRVSELLKSMKVYVRGKDADVLVLETTDIHTILLSLRRCSLPGRRATLGLTCGK